MLHFVAEGAPGSKATGDYSHDQSDKIAPGDYATAMHESEHAAEMHDAVCLRPPVSFSRAGDRLLFLTSFIASSNLVHSFNKAIASHLHQHPASSTTSTAPKPTASVRPFQGALSTSREADPIAGLLCRHRARLPVPRRLPPRISGRAVMTLDPPARATVQVAVRFRLLCAPTHLRVRGRR
jgi:hypothetical protein